MPGRSLEQWHTSHLWAKVHVPVTGSLRCSSLATMATRKTIQRRASQRGRVSVLSRRSSQCKDDRQVSSALPQLDRSLCHGCLDTGKYRPRPRKRRLLPEPLRVQWPYILKYHREVQSWTRVLGEQDFKFCVPSSLKQNQCILLSS